MNRELLQKMLEWKNKVECKPLIIRGARVGKIWLMKEFGRTGYKKWPMSILRWLAHCMGFLRAVLIQTNFIKAKYSR